MADPHVEKFIRLLADSVPDADRVYREGNCFKLFLLLRHVWPNAEAWYDQVEGHVYTKIGKSWYDIRGCLPEAAKKGLELYAEHTEDAQAHPGKHPNIDRLIALVAEKKTLRIKHVFAV